MVRESGRWREVSCHDAFLRCDELIHAVRDRYGYAGNAAVNGIPVEVVPA